MFPVRLTRDALGPTIEDQYPVQNPRTQIGEGTWNPLFWATAGMSQTAVRAAVLANWNSGSSQFDIAHQGEAWNPKGTQARPVLARTSAGVYTYTFAASYLDHNDVAQATVLLAARLSDRKVLTVFADRLEARAWINGGAPLVVQMRLWDASGSAVDAPFWLEVF